MATADNALVIMTKAPQSGQSKTRLVPPLSFEEAADLARALLVDQLENLAQFTGARLFIAFTPAKAAGFFTAFEPQGFSCFAQQGESLGERMKHVFQHLFGGGFRNVILIGSELPAVPLKFFELAYDSLDRPAMEVVLGPSVDGGYYLVGMSRWIGEIFEGITWSRDDVLARTLEKLQGLGLNYELLPPWYDIDTREDLRRLQSHCGGQDGLMKKTLTLLREFRQRGKI